MTIGIFLLSILAGMLTSELTDIVPSIARRILRWHVGRLPHTLQERASEEWSADMEAMPSRVGKLLFALDLFRAVNGMVWEAARRAEPITLVDDLAGLVAKQRHDRVKAIRAYIQIITKVQPSMAMHAEAVRKGIEAMQSGTKTGEFTEAMLLCDEATQERLRELIRRTATAAFEERTRD